MTNKTKRHEIRHGARTKVRIKVKEIMAAPKQLRLKILEQPAPAPQKLQLKVRDA